MVGMGEEQYFSLSACHCLIEPLINALLLILPATRSILVGNRILIPMLRVYILLAFLSFTPPPYPPTSPAPYPPPHPTLPGAGDEYPRSDRPACGSGQHAVGELGRGHAAGTPFCRERKRVSAATGPRDLRGKVRHGGFLGFLGFF